MPPWLPSSVLSRPLWKHNLGITTRSSYSAGPGVGGRHQQGQSSSRSHQCGMAGWEQQALGCQQALGHRQGKADAQADWIPFQESQRFTPGSASLGPSWVTSGESQTQKSWGVAEAQSQLSAEPQGLCCPFLRLLLSQPCLGHWLATKGDTEGQTGFAFPQHPPKSRGQTPHPRPLLQRVLES